ncbi:subtilisin-like protein [Acephala macrosclerotiorum]|nr:subtilisin-like protein [Acephala macrosclerotiorum]
MSLGSIHNVHRPELVSSHASEESTKLILDKSSQPKLVSYIVSEDKSTQERIVTWTDTHDEVITHPIPMGIKGIPYTFHSAMGSKHENVVAFRHWDALGKNIKHKFLFEDDGSQIPVWHNPEYHFLCEEDSREFQGRVRGRRLLQTFDTDVMSIIQTHVVGPSTPKAYAKKVPIKLWRRNDTAITFFATFDSMKHQTHLQFYLSWFNKEAELHDDRKLVLKLNNKSDIEQQYLPSRSQSKRKLSFASLASAITSKGKRPKAEDSTPRRISLPENSSQRVVKIHDGELKTDASLKDGWEGLEIQFTHDGDAEEFVATCLQSQTELGLAAHDSPHFVQPYSNQGQEETKEKSLPTRPHFQELIFAQYPEKVQLEPLSPISPGPSRQIDPVFKEEDVEDEMRKRRSRAAIEKWWQTFNDNRDEIFPIITDNYAPVKIAIVDTGIDTNNPYIEKHWDTKRFYRDFLQDDDAASHLRVNSTGYSEPYVQEVIVSLGSERRDEVVDLAGHGTHLAGVVLQLTPHASLCVARVLKDNLTTYDTGKAARRVALAILYAVHVWKVKVINLSIGFDEEKLGVPESQVVIHALQYARQQNVVVLAAASNSGNREKLAFPACKPDHVLSINSTDGNGGRSWFNPQKQEYHENLSILGEYIKSTWLQVDCCKEGTFMVGESVWKRQEGTSQATTIAACVAVLILQFGRQYGVGEKLETFEGVRSVLRAMTQGKTDDGFRDIVPWIDVFRMSHGVDAIKMRIRDILPSTCIIPPNKGETRDASDL